jgi:hypothetical protein
MCGATRPSVPTFSTLRRTGSIAFSGEKNRPPDSRTDLTTTRTSSSMNLLLNRNSYAWDSVGHL